jgi:hypothetical protein
VPISSSLKTPICKAKANPSRPILYRTKLKHCVNSST